MKLHVLTDEGQSHNRTHLDIVKAGIEGGATIIQYRDKSSSTLRMYETALEIVKLTQEANIPLIVNDRLDIAMAVDADGIHLGQSDLPIPVARKLWKSNKIYGASASTIQEALKAEKDGADYIGFGPVFGGRIVYEVKPDAALPSGLETLREVVSIVKIPIIAIGGITQSNLREVLDTGVKGVAVVAAVAWAEDMVKATQNLRVIIDEYHI